MNEGSIIGFIGDGQLARMSAHKAIELGFVCHFFGNNIDGPCHGLGNFFTGSIDDIELLSHFARTCDVITLENEFVKSEILKKIEKITPLYPTAKSFTLIENKFIEKETFNRLGIPTCSYKLITNLIEDIREFNFPIILKSSKGGYDGFGNIKCSNNTQAQEAFHRLGGNLGQDIIIEQMVPFIKEVAITVARNKAGNIITYPVVDTIQENHICTKVIAPALINKSVHDKVEGFAIKAMEGTNSIGVFSFEFFVLADDNVLINESAPRPHNSAHYSMDACETSQFENHIRAITNMNLGPSKMKVKKATMINLIGINEYTSNDQNEFVHLYGKKENKSGRKMGHINKIEY